MLGRHVKPLVAVVVDPVASALLRGGLTPNRMTVLGTVATCCAALLLFPTNHLFLGALVVWITVMADMLDGAMARLRGYGTRFGAVLDATCDRIADGVILGSLVWWNIAVLGVDRSLLVATLISLIASQVISYVKARAEASGLRADGGLVERPERLIIVLVGAALTGLGWSAAMHIALWILAIGSLFTIAQRVWSVRTSPQADAPLAPVERGQGAE